MYWFELVSQVSDVAHGRLVQKALSQFHPNLAENILGLWVLKFIQMKDLTLSLGEIIMKKRKYIDKIWKSSSQEPI